jgi:hypothetical protein
MKRMNELSEQEILALTDEQIDTMIKYRMAEEGIKILSKPDQPNYTIIPPKDNTLYKTKGFTFVFVTLSTAQMFADLVKDYKSELHIKDWDKEYLKKYNPDNYDFKELGTVQSEEIYSKELSIKIKDDISYNEKLKKEYDALMDEYKQADSDKKDVYREVWEKYYEVLNKYTNFNSMLHQYKAYLVLAEDNADIAMNFLKKAYTIDEETEQYITNNLNN